jgi:hypothetical protein
MSAPAWLDDLNPDDIVGIVVSRRVPNPDKPGETAVAIQAWLDPNIPLRVASAMEKMLVSAAYAVARDFRVIEQEPEEELPPGDGGGTFH